MNAIVPIAIILILAFLAYSSYASAQAEKKRRIEEEKKRREAILAHLPQWGEAVCQIIIERKIAPNMTREMVKLAWGMPKTIDQTETTAKGLVKERWVYGQPRKGANYIYFTDGKVAKIKQ
jgi:hypothetical protein